MTVQQAPKTTPAALTWSPAVYRRNSLDELPHIVLSTLVQCIEDEHDIVLSGGINEHLPEGSERLERLLLFPFISIKDGVCGERAFFAE